MRIRRLDLLAFGHFTGAGFDLPAKQPDIHFVYGLNEAGKSTALGAIEDLLFGIPHNSPHNFLHDYANIRLGAIVESNGATLEFRRRKGKNDTLLTKDGLPLPTGESVLAPFLNGAERAFFSRMFCLDHERLRQGGREILEAQDDVGQILFSAGAGIAGLRELLKKLHADADSLWGSRRAGHRKFSQAEDRLKAAESALREHTVTASRWNELRAALDEANEAYDGLEAEIEIKTAEQRRLNRIRRVYRNVQKHAEANKRIEELDEVISLPETASRELEEALNNDALAQTRLAALTEQIDALRAERLALTYDEALLARSDDINRLHERRIQVRDGKSDLPKRRAELAAAEGELKRLAAELDWQTNDSGQILARIPARTKLATARGLSKRGGELAAAESNARTACGEADERVSALTQELDDVGALADISGLTAIIGVVHEAGDIRAQLLAAEKDVKAAADSVQGLLNSMRPPLGGEHDLAALSVPRKDVLEHYRDRSRELAQYVKTCQEQIRNTELLLERRRKEYERTAGDERAIPAEELRRLRAHRETGWSIIRRKYIENAAVPDDEIEAFDTGGALPEAYETAIRGADEAADLRFERAEATGRLAGIARQIAEQEEYFEELRGQELGYGKDEAELAAEWLTLWKGVPLTPLGPDNMLGWIDTRSQILQALETKAGAERETASLRTEETRLKDLLIGELGELGELGALGVDTGPLAGRPLRFVLERTVDIQRQHQGRAESRRKLEETLKKAETESARKRKNLESTGKSVAEWKDRWSAAIALLGLNPAALPETQDAQIEAIDAMREVASRINDLKHERIEKIERDITAFQHEVAALVASIAPHLADMDEDESVLELERLLTQAKRAQELARAADARILDEEKKIEESQKARRNAENVIERLQRMASVASVDDLRKAIENSDELRSLQAEQNTALRALAEDGDGMSAAELAQECAAADLDQTAAREQTVSQDLADLRTRQMEAGETRSAARREFDAIGGDDRAAAAATDRQAALAEMREIVEEYVRLRSAELLLQWAIDRYRREKQAPLLKRAGALFAALTGGSFKDLRVEFDEQDRAQLAGIRGNSRNVKVSGMSSGTADQLYLALRVAAVEDFLSHAAPLPFIADDLFINFDDHRAAAGFEVLAELAQKTQVLFFSHHKHLLDIAAATLGPGLSTVLLSPSVVEPAAALPEHKKIV
ncbi:MAG: AAA family ATPase [Candidatus Acidiferrales bacterium]